MTTYLLPCSNGNYCWIEKIRARNFSDAEQKFIEAFVNDDSEMEVPSDWDDLIRILQIESDIIIGSIYDIEEF